MIPKDIKDKIEAEANDIYRLAEGYDLGYRVTEILENQKIAFNQGAEFGYSLASPKQDECKHPFKSLYINWSFQEVECQKCGKKNI